MKPGDDPALGAIKEAARAGDRLADPRWEALSRGELSPEAQAELRREDAEAFEALRPLDESAAARILDAIGPPQAKVIPLRPRWRAPAAVFAIAAAVVLAVYLGGRPSGPLPGYEVALTGGDRDVRSGGTPAPSTVRLEAPDSRLEVRLRPATAVQGAVEWRCTAGDRPWTPAGRVTEGGTIVIEGTRRQLFGARPGGPLPVRCAVGRPGAMTQQLAFEVLLGEAR